MVRLPVSAKNNIEALRNTRLITDSGAQVPLHALADIRPTRGANTITRENVQRVRVVVANVADRDLVSVVDDMRDKLGQNLELPQGYHIEYGGQFESAAQASQLLLILGVVVIMGIFVLLMIAMPSVRDALLVMLNLPLALIGGVAGVFIADGVLSIAAIIGFITLFGIATRNGVIMIDYIQNLCRENPALDLIDAVKQGAEERLAPILMTALATGLVLVPLAMSLGKPGSDPGPNGVGHPLRSSDLNCTEHDRRIGTLLAIRARCAITGWRSVICQSWNSRSKRANATHPTWEVNVNETIIQESLPVGSSMPQRQCLAGRLRDIHRPGSRR